MLFINNWHPLHPLHAKHEKRKGSYMMMLNKEIPEFQKLQNKQPMARAKSCFLRADRSRTGQKKGQISFLK